MKTFNTYIPKHDWMVRVYIGFEPEQTQEVMELLRDIGCSREKRRRAYRNLHSGQLNNGMTVASYRERTAVVVIGRTSSPAEFLDSLVHEVMHLAMYIAIGDGIDLDSEETCYIGGDVARAMYPYCKPYLCCKCHH